MTLAQIQSAVAATKPFAQMDQLVRQELAAGRTVAEIVADVSPLVDDVLALPGLTDDGEEAFLGTLDALLGNCRADQCYTDPPRSTLAAGSVPNAPTAPSPATHPV